MNFTLFSVLGHSAGQIASEPNEFNHFLLAAYIIMWIVALVYIFSLASRQRNTRQELKLLKELLKEDEESRAG